MINTRKQADIHTDMHEDRWMEWWKEGGMNGLFEERKEGWEVGWMD